MDGSLCPFSLFHSLIEYIGVSKMVTLDPGYFSTILIISLYFLVTVYRVILASGNFGGFALK